MLGLPHALPAGLGVVAESIILGWLSLLCIHGEKWLGRLGRDAGDAGRSFNFQALSTAQVTALDRLLTLRLSSVPFPAKHWAKRLLRVRTSRRCAYQSELTSELLWASAFSSTNWEGHPHFEGVKPTLTKLRQQSRLFSCRHWRLTRSFSGSLCRALM